MSTHIAAELETPDDAPAFDHAITEADDGSTECTIFPRDCSDSELVTHWLTAKSGAFVPLIDAR